MNRERNALIEEVLNPSVKTTEFVDLDSSGEGEEEQNSEEDAVTSGAYINFGQVVNRYTTYYQYSSNSAVWSTGKICSTPIYLFPILSFFQSCLLF